VNRETELYDELGRTKSELYRLRRKVEHRCIDAYCTICDVLMTTPYEIWEETPLSGEILMTEKITTFSLIKELKEAELRHWYTQDELNSSVEDGTFNKEEADNISRNGDVEDLITDTGAEILLTKTTTGTYLIISQSVDGHGNLSVVTKRPKFKRRQHDQA
jgi:hypothetical protein